MRAVVDAVVEAAARHWAASRPVERQDLAWRVVPDDLSAFSRGAADPAPTARATGRRSAGAAAGPPGRGRVGRRARRARAQARVDAGTAPPRPTTTTAPSTSSATSVWSRCARRPAAPTGPSAGTRAPPRSCSTVSGAHGRAASASSTPVIPRRSTPPSPSGSPRPSSRMGLDFAVLTAVARDDLDRRRGRCLRGHHPGDPRSGPGDPCRGAHPRLQGRPRRARRHLRGPARGAEPQHRDRAPAPAGGAAVGLVRPQPRRCWPGPRPPGS